MAEPALNNNRHAHPPDYWLAGGPEGERKEKVRLRILIAALVVATLLLVLCILLAIGKAQIRGYVPTLVLELDLSPIGKEFIVLGTIKLPEIQDPLPEKLDFPAQTFEKDLEFNQAFIPVVKRRVEYTPVYKF